MKEARKWPLWGTLALAGLCALFFGRLLGAGFVYDDLWMVVRNPALRHFTPLAFFLDPLTSSPLQPGMAVNNFRPLAVLSLSLDWAAWGLRPALFHAENVAWHGINALLVLALARRLLKNEAGAWVAACVFLLHPVQVETAAWVAQRSNLLCAAGLLAALALLLGETLTAPRLAAAGAAYLFALFSKEEAVVLPMLLLSCELCGVAPRRPAKERLRCYAVLVALTAAYALVRTAVGHPWSQFKPGEMSWSADLMLGLLAFRVYLGKLLLPTALRVSYDYPIPDAWAVAAAGAVFYAYLAAAGALVRRKSFFGLVLLWIFISLLPVLHLAPLRPFVAERFLYIAVAGAGLAAGWAYERGGWRRWAMVVWLIFLAAQTALAVPHWMTEKDLWAAAVAAEPGNAFARACYAEELKDPAQAERQYRAALVSRPSRAVHFSATNNLSGVELALGRPGEAAYWARLALKEEPGDLHALYNLCGAYEAAKDPRRGDACAALRRRQSAPSLP